MRARAGRTIGSEKALAGVEQALRNALAVTSPEQVIRQVKAVFPDELAEIDPERFPGPTRQMRNESLGKLLNEMDEIYGPVPQELLDQAEREWPDFDEEPEDDVE